MMLVTFLVVLYGVVYLLCVQMCILCTLFGQRIFLPYIYFLNCCEKRNLTELGVDMYGVFNIKLTTQSE